MNKNDFIFPGFDDNNPAVEIVPNFEDNDGSRPLCALGVLKTPEGLNIEQEMLACLSTKYDVISIRQDAPGVEFEYPAIKYAFDISKVTGESVLYLHTKGAASPTPIQRLIRMLWYNEFINNHDAYVAMLERHKGDPVLIAPFTGPNKETWFNGFFINPAMAEVFEPQRSSDRYYYECLLKNTPFGPIGRLLQKVSGYSALGYVNQFVATLVNRR